VFHHNGDDNVLGGVGIVSRRNLGCLVLWSTLTNNCYLFVGTINYKVLYSHPLVPSMWTITSLHVDIEISAYFLGKALEKLLLLIDLAVVATSPVVNMLTNLKMTTVTSLSLQYLFSKCSGEFLSSCLKNFNYMTSLAIYNPKMPVNVNVIVSSALKCRLKHFRLLHCLHNSADDDIIKNHSRALLRVLRSRLHIEKLDWELCHKHTVTKQWTYTSLHKLSLQFYPNLKCLHIRPSITSVAALSTSIKKIFFSFLNRPFSLVLIGLSEHQQCQLRTSFKYTEITCYLVKLTSSTGINMKRSTDMNLCIKNRQADN
jgi:hypothetical protein